MITDDIEDKMLFMRTLFSLFFPNSAISAEFSQLLREIKIMSTALDTLITEVAESRTVTESAVVLLQGLS